MKKWMSMGLSLVLSLSLLAGCTSGGSQPTAQPSGGTPSASNSGKSYKIAMVAAGSFGDQGMNDAMLNGMKMFTEDSGIEVTSVEVAEFSDQAINARNFAQQGYDMVVMAGPVSKEIPEIAGEYPETHFLLNKGTVTDLPNVTSVVFDEAGAAFLGGAFAVLMSKELGGDTKVGWVGGERIPDLEKARYAFVAAAEYVGGSVDVVYVGSFTDIAKGKEIANQMYNNGAAIVQAYAGGASNGVYQAAEAQGENRYAMGSATGQFHLSPDRIIASSVVRYDDFFAQVLGQYVADGKLEGGAIVANLVNDGTGLRYSPTLGDKVPESIKDKIGDLKAKIVAGEITVPTTEEEYKAFKPAA